MDNFDLKKYIAEGKLHENHPSEVFTDVELDMASEMLMDMFDKLGLENNVEKSDALVKYINGWFATTDFVNEGKLLKEEDYSDLDRKTVVASGKKPYVKGVKVNSQVLAKELEYVLGKLSDKADKNAVQKAIAATSTAPEVGEEEIFDKIKDYLPEKANTEGGYAINGAFLRAYYLH